MKKLTILALILIFLLTGCDNQGTIPSADKQPEAVKTGYTDISISELENMLKNKDFVLVNVHVPFEGNIPNTDLSIPYNTIDQHLDQLPADKNAKIVLYCSSDSMSNIAAKTLVQNGYSNIANLVGGFSNWEKAGLPLEK
jgi:rhodanese-related sulfurtransferase